MLIMACLLLNSCGKKGPLEPLEKSDYPRTYPKPIEEDLDAEREQKAGTP
jgi:predicted small lipoprotein YifL